MCTSITGLSLIHILRGYENGSLTPYGSEGYAYVRLGAELRYPLMLENSTSIYAPVSYTHLDVYKRQGQFITYRFQVT